ncbi:endothelin-converting enzyme-like 1, partial [Paramuricea clavata]
MWNAIRELISTLPVAFRDAYDKYKKDYGVEHPIDRWETCCTLTNRAFEYATTLLYVNEYVSEEAMETVGELFTEIKNQFINGLKEQDWMDDATRAQAHLKLDKMRKNIGYPPFIKDPGKLNKFYENVDVSKSQLLQNQLSFIRDNAMKKLDTLGRLPDDKKYVIPMSSIYIWNTNVRSKNHHIVNSNIVKTQMEATLWFLESPLEVNAYYYPPVNGMTVLAGILQPPFYRGDTLKALTYGSLGTIVGHEITHGFDKQGSQFDENGNIRSWWTKRSHNNFVKRSKCLIKQYNKVKVYGVQ